MNKFIFEYKENKYVCKYETVTLEKTIEIDFQSYKNSQFNSFNEMLSVFSILHIQIFKENELVFDSYENSFENIHFDIVKKVYPELKKNLNISSEEIDEYLNICKEFISSKNKNIAMPKELLVAKKIFRNELKLTHKEMMEMPAKEYEKIYLAINLFKQAVNEF